MKSATSSPQNQPSLTANAVSNYVRFVLSMVCMFLMTPFVISQLGTEDYGLWMLILCIVGYFELLDCGLATATVKFVSSAKGAGDDNRRDSLVSTLWFTYLGIAVVMGLLSIALYCSFDSLFQLPESQLALAGWLFAIMSVRLIVNLPLSLFLGVLFGQQRIVSVNLVKISSTLIYTVTVCLALMSGYGLLTLGLLNALAFTLEHAAYLLLCKKHVKELKISVKLFDFSILREVLSFSCYAFLINIASVILLRTDPLIISWFLPLTAVAVYALGLKIAEQFMLLTKQFINVFSPVFAELNGAGNEEKIRSVFLSSTRHALAATLLMAYPLLFIGEAALVLWVGESFRMAGAVLSLLILAMIIKVAQETASNVLGMTGHHRWIAGTGIISAVVNLVLSMLLIQPLGLSGVALATLLSTLAVGIGGVIFRLCKLHQITLYYYWNEVIRPLCWPLLMQSVIMLLLNQMGEPTTWFLLFIYGMSGAIAFSVTYWLLSLTYDERQVIAEKVAHIQRKLSTVRQGVTT